MFPGHARTPWPGPWPAPALPILTGARLAGGSAGRPAANGPGGGQRTWRPSAGRRMALPRQHRRVGAEAWRRSGKYTGERAVVKRA